MGDFSNIMSTVTQALLQSPPASQLLLYTHGPFFSVPWRAPLNALVGSSYETAYLHFARDHTDPTNLALHVACLLLTLAANFAMLGAVEAKLKMRTAPLQFLTMTGWCAALALAPCPDRVKAGSVLLVVLGRNLGPRLLPDWTVAAWFQGAIAAGAVEFILLPEKGKDAGGLAFAGVLAAWTAVWLLLTKTRLRGALKTVSTPVCFAVLAAMVRLVTGTDPVRGGLYAFGNFAIWPLALMVDEPWLFWVGAGFALATAQGVAHRLSGEASTVEQLQTLGSHKKLPYEWGHHTFFPNLLLHALHDRFLK